eukprot:6881281-Pyramimonas_sp.AAC.1
MPVTVTVTESQSHRVTESPESPESLARVTESQSHIVTESQSHSQKKGTPVGVVHRAQGPSYWAAGRTGLRASQRVTATATVTDSRSRSHCHRHCQLRPQSQSQPQLVRHIPPHSANIPPHSANILQHLSPEPPPHHLEQDLMVVVDLTELTLRSGPYLEQDLMVVDLT